MPSPRPRLAPVISTVRARGLPITPGQFAGRRNVERRHDADRRWHLVQRQHVAAKLQNVGFDRAGFNAGTFALEHDVGGHDRAGDRAALRPHQRHADLRMTVDHRFDLFGVNLEAADVDDAAAAAGEHVAVAGEFHHVAGIDETVGIGERYSGADITRRRAWRTDAQRAVFDLHLDAVAIGADIGRGETSTAVADLE